MTLTGESDVDWRSTRRTGPLWTHRKPPRFPSLPSAFLARLCSVQLDMQVRVLRVPKSMSHREARGPGTSSNPARALPKVASVVTSLKDLVSVLNWLGNQRARRRNH